MKEQRNDNEGAKIDRKKLTPKFTKNKKKNQKKRRIN